MFFVVVLVDVVVFVVLCILKGVCGGGVKKLCSNYELIVVLVSVYGINLVLILKNVVCVIDMLQQVGFCVFIVGGVVCDLLFGIVLKDFDVVIDVMLIEVQCLFCCVCLIGCCFQIVYVQFGQELIEVLMFCVLVDVLFEVVMVELLKCLKCDEFDCCMYVVDVSGCVLCDNVWGEQYEDVVCCDFMINVMYYDLLMQMVFDYYDGMVDVCVCLLWMIGDLVMCFCEDLVWMLCVVCFVVKFGFEIELYMCELIYVFVDLINNVLVVCLFDEMLKLLLLGYVFVCLQWLCKEGLYYGLLLLFDVVLEQLQGEKFIMFVLNNIDVCVCVGKLVLLGFLFVMLLWYDMCQCFE